MSSDQMLAPGKIKIIKFPPPGQEKTSNARGMPGGGGGCWSFDLTDTLIWNIHDDSKKHNQWQTAPLSTSDKKKQCELVLKPGWGSVRYIFFQSHDVYIAADKT